MRFCHSLICLLALASFASAADKPAPDPAFKAVVDKVNATGASLMPVAADGKAYRFTALNVAKDFNDAGLAALAPAAEKITSVDLARTKVTDAGLAGLAPMKNLTELHLENTGITDAGLDHLKGLAALEYLNLYNTKVTDAGAQKLAGLTKLKALYLWQTGVTKAGVAQLKAKLPGAQINTGWTAEDDAKAVAVAATPVLAEAKPVAKAAPAAAKPAGKLDAAVATKAVVYKDVIAPILEAKCVNCHGAEKKKGKLQLHDFASIMKGGSEGDVNVVPGKPDESLLIGRIKLPEDDDDHMPPSDEPQVTKEELALLRWWIAGGASDTVTVAAAKPTPEVEPALAVLLGKAAPAAKPAAVAKAPAAKPKAAAATPAAATGKLDPAVAAKAVIYKDVIAPILEAKCVSCHGVEKKKGKLQLHDFASIIKGGSEGDVNVVVGKPDESLLLERINLPVDDDDHMPPSDEPQVSKEELALLKWWIANGASETATVASVKATPDVASALALVLGKGLPKATAKVAKVDDSKPVPLTDAEKKQVAEITAKIQALNASLMPLAQDTEQLRLSVINATDKFGDAELALLEPIAKHVVWVDLARSKVTDAGAETLAKMNSLERLHLENTKVSDTGLAKIATLQQLEYLNLYGTKTTDAGIAALARAKGLTKLFVWQTGVTKAGATALEGKLPGLKVNVGLSEAEIAKLTAPPPTPPPAPAPAPAKKEEPKKDAAKPEAKKVEPKPEAKKADAPPAAKPEAAKKTGDPAAEKAKAKPAPATPKAD